MNAHKRVLAALLGTLLLMMGNPGVKGQSVFDAARLPVIVFAYRKGSVITVRTP